MHLETL